MSKINATELLKLHQQGMLGIELAEHFSVSPAAISKALAKIKPVTLPQSMAGLTDKEQRYVIERSSGKSKTDAAQAAFQCERTSAKTLGCRLDKDPDVSQAMADILHQEGAGRRRRMQRLVDVIESPNLSEACRGIELAARVCGDMAADKLEVTHSIDPQQALEALWRMGQIQRTDGLAPPLINITSEEISA